MRYIHSNKKGLSIVVATILMISLTLVATGIVWTITQEFVDKETTGAKECFDAFDKLTVGNQYSCYDADAEELKFSIEVGRLNITRAMIQISSSTNSTKFELNDSASYVEHLTNYDGTESVSLPRENSGDTYSFASGAAGFLLPPETIRIAPIIGKNQCDVSDTILNFTACPQ